MLKVGEFLIATAAITAANLIQPTPKPSVATEQKGPDQSVEQKQRHVTVDRIPTPSAAAPGKRQLEKVEKDSGVRERSADNFENLKTIIEAISILVTAFFTGALAFWTWGLRNETKNLVDRAKIQENKMAASVEAMNRLADETHRLVERTDTQNERMGESADAMRDAAKAMEGVAAESKRMADAAGQQTAIIGAQADIQLKQQRIARMQFIATHRPRFELQRIVLEQFEIGKQPKISLIIANEGSSEVKIVEANFAIEIPRNGSLPDQRPNSDRWDGQLADLDVYACSGLPMTVTRTANLQAWEWDSLYSIMPAGGGAIFLVAEIEYRDAIEITRAKGFCFEFDKIRRRFREIDDPIYNFGS